MGIFDGGDGAAVVGVPGHGEEGLVLVALHREMLAEEGDFGAPPTHQTGYRSTLQQLFSNGGKHPP